MKNSKSKLVLSFVTMTMLTGCFTQQQVAEVEDKSGYYYGRKGVKNNPGYALSPKEVTSTSYSTDEQISVKSLTPLENSSSDSYKAPQDTKEHYLEAKRDSVISSQKNRDTKEGVYNRPSKPKSEIDAYEAKNDNPKLDSSDLTYEPEAISAGEHDAKKGIKESASSIISQSNFHSKTPLGSTAFAWPIEGDVISRYGKAGNKFNEGINIAAPAGTIVNAASDGKVIYVGKKVEGYGNLMIIKHKNDYMTAYAHLQDVLIEKGAEVKKGESVATVGQSGSVDKPQLHFSLRKGKKTINPEASSG